MRSLVLFLCAFACRAAEVAPQREPAPAPTRPRIQSETERCNDELHGEQKDAVLARVSGLYQGLAVRWDGLEPRCPPVPVVTVEVLVSPATSAPERDKPCFGLVTVDVRVRTGDGTIDDVFQGWLNEHWGSWGIGGKDRGITLPQRPGQPVRLREYGLREVDACCAETVTDAERALIASVRGSGLHKVTFPDLNTSKMRRTELEVVVLQAQASSNTCGETTATVELLNRARQVAAAGEARLRYGLVPCPAGASATDVCGTIHLGISASVQNTFALVGQRGGQRLQKLSGFLQARVDAGVFHDVVMSFEVSGDGPVGIAMGTEP